MKVWILEHESYGDVTVWSAETNPLDIPLVKAELDALANGYDEEVQEFIEDLESGSGYANIEERFSIELVEVKSI